MDAVKVCPINDAACAEVPRWMRCEGCMPARASIGKEDALLGEPVAWQYRNFESGLGFAERGWSEWEEVKPRHERQTMEERMAELRGYKNVELRPLYSRPSQGEAMEALRELVESTDAYQASLPTRNWQSHDADKLKAEAAVQEAAFNRNRAAWDRARSLTKGDGNV